MIGIGKRAETTLKPKKVLNTREGIEDASLDDGKNRGERIQMGKTGIGRSNNPPNYYPNKTSKVKSAGGYKSGERKEKP